ncbi:hypothetical protein GGTG_08972 [Gaeumannomyces tritici R3-111a-1]|uniref:Major facilitator superfamily (MFS) profile domain-containing protein n=1 Tax=Gaeumannomyces tritici (strain R3-111a-1) TaxID=644352 RepID=J3P632_GAET3|nr:hypothetical protein GGTG_08972 [Gaeumannomyces tritici R3-111a-1]EJT75134.1 hypothetical protein GGTG_08972 [Gaeumannomyces tritici R3-111a-1]
MATRPLADMAARRPSADLASSVYLIASDGRTRSLPIPSDSPNDPLNWSRCTRIMLLVSLAVLAGVGVTQLNAPPIMRHALALEFGEDRLAGFDMATTTPDVMFGVGVIVWTPLCIGLGRRPVLLLSASILLFALAAAGLAPSLEVLIAAIGFQGLACGGVPTAGILMVIDITYIHQRPLCIAVLWSVGRGITFIILALMPTALPIETRWRSFYLIGTAVCCVALVLVFFFCPETYFLRPPVVFDGRVLVQSGSEKVRIYDLSEGQSESGKSGQSGQSGSVGQTAEQTGRDSPYYIDHSELFKDQNRGRPKTIDERRGGKDRKDLEAYLDQHKHQIETLNRDVKRKDVEAYMKSKGTPRHLTLRRAACADWRGAWMCLPQMLLCIANPLIFWVALHKGVLVLGTVVIRSQVPRALHRPPYSMSSPDVGLMDLSAALGCFAALPITYAITASTVGTLTRRNAGVRKATYYLPGFILPVLCGALANVLFGLTAVPPGGDGYVDWVHHWAFVAVAWVLAQVAFTGEAVVSTLWVTEAFPQWAAGALAAVNGLSFTFSCLLGFSAPQWLASQGHLRMNVEIAAAILVAGGMGIPLAFWGKGLRQYLPGRCAVFEGGALRPQ